MISKTKKLIILQEKFYENLTDTPEITTKTWEKIDKSISKFVYIKVIIENRRELPNWRKIKNKNPMVMIDEIELYRN